LELFELLLNKRALNLCHEQYSLPTSKKLCELLHDAVEGDTDLTSPSASEIQGLIGQGLPAEIHRAAKRNNDKSQMGQIGNPFPEG
jgi:hypothetical protein